MFIRLIDYNNYYQNYFCFFKAYKLFFEFSGPGVIFDIVVDVCFSFQKFKSDI